MRRLPKRVNLGGNYIIVVKVVSPEDIAKALQETDWALQAISNGSWDVEKKQILINNTLSQKQRWEVFRHEMVHAALDAELYERPV